MQAAPKDAEAAKLWMLDQRKKRGWSTIKLADVARAIAQREGSPIKLTQQSVSGFETGNPKRMPEWFRYIRMAFEEGEPAALQDIERRDELVYIRQVDVRYAMGDGTNIDDYPDVKLVPFNLGFVQAVTTATTDRLFLAEGFGDSMEPTILKHDQVLIDTTDTRAGIGDTIWALEYAGSGYIKRLRRVKRDGKTKLLIVSDNSLVPPEEAEPDDVTIVGKVVWIARRM